MAELTNARTGEKHPIGAKGASIGRHSSNDIVLPGRSMSRYHAEIKSNGPQYYIRDLGSMFGTYLNGKRIDAEKGDFVSLSNGDTLWFGVNPAWPKGEYELVFNMTGGAIGSVPAGNAAAPVDPTPETLPAVDGAASSARGTLKYGSDAGAIVVKLDGAFRSPEINAMEEDVMSRARSERNNVVLDLTGVTYMNSYVFGTLVKMQEKLEVAGLRLAIAGASGNVARLLNMIGIARLVPTSQTVADAIKSLR